MIQALLLALLAALGGPLAPQDGPPQDGPGGAPPRAEAPLVAVHHRSDLALRDRLLARAEVWLDAGDFLVGRFPRPLVDALRGRGLAVETLPELGAGEELYLLVTADPKPDPEFDARLRALGARALLVAGRQALIAAPKGAHARLHGLAPAAMHCGVLPVPARPIAPPRPFTAGPSGGALALAGPDARVQAIVDAVDVTRVEATVQSLSAIFSRRANTSGAITARDQIVAELQSLGFSPTLQPIGSGFSENVIAEVPGTADPGRIVVIGAHYDSINGAGAGLAAPGADDNASGTAGVLEAARVFSTAGPFKYTLRFITFSGEEFGLVGSGVAASQSAAAGEDVIAMLNMDMNAYRAPGDVRDVDFATNNTSASLTNFCDQVGALYVPGWASTSGVLTAGSSDHASYNAQGFPAAFFFEDLSQFYPGIHTSSDAYPTSTNDFQLSEMILKGVVASAAVLAEPLDLAITHTPLQDTQSLGPYPVVAQVTSLVGSNVVGVDLTWRVQGGVWQTVPMVLSGSDWSASIPGQGSPVTIEYYLTAYDDQSGSETLPAGADLGAAPFAFFVGVRTVHYATGFEGAGDGGWTHGLVATQDDWQRGAPQGKAGDPSSAYEGTAVWGNDLGPSGWNGEYQPNVENWLRSPVIDLSAAPNVHLQFRRWLTVEDALYDQAQVRVNGQVVWQNEAGTPGDDQHHTLDSEWKAQSLDISALAAGHPSVQIEFRLISDGGLQFGGWNLDDLALVSLEPVSCPPPIAFCTTSPNSAGPGARMGWSGEPSIAANSFWLTVTAAAPGQNGIFYYGPNQVQTPFGNGVRCVGGGVVRLPVIQTDAFGDAQLHLDFTTLPPGGAITPNSTWNFQFWYRDPPGGGATFNLSDGLSVTFCP